MSKVSDNRPSLLQSFRASSQTAARRLTEHTEQNTVDTDHRRFNSEFDLRGGNASGTKGFGQNLADIATIKTIKTKPVKNAEPGVKKGALEKKIDSLGVTVGRSSFEAEVGVASKGVDQKKVQSEGYDTGYRVLSAYAEGSGSAKIGKVTRLQGSVTAGAVLAQGEVQGNAQLGGVNLSGQAQGTVGVVGTANGRLAVDLFGRRPTVKLRAGVEAFAGAKVSAEGRVDTQYGGVGVRGEAMAGVGVKANVNAGIENGRFKAKVELGAALGIGGSVGFDVDVNYEQIGKKAVDLGRSAVNTVVSGASAAVDGAKNLVSSGWNTVSGWFH